MNKKYFYAYLFDTFPEYMKRRRGHSKLGHHDTDLDTYIIYSTHRAGLHDTPNIT
jgi:hypothetical protein